MYLLTRLTLALPPALRPYAKAVYPAIGTLVAIGVTWLDTGDFDAMEVRTAIGGAIATLLAYAPPNLPARSTDQTGPVA